MECIFYLSGDFIDLGKEEVISLFDAENSRLIGRLLIVDLKNVDSLNKSSRRLALTKGIYRLLFECSIGDLIKTMKDFGWNSVYKDDFCLRVNNLEDYNKNSIKKIRYTEKRLAGYIWSNLKNPKVNLENPKTKIELFIFNNKAYCGLLVKEIKENFESRKAHLRPFPHPSSLHPKVARALVNISEIRENKILLDPFCGTGGFLIEAGLMGIKSVGYDISRIMADGCKENLKHFKIKNCRIKKQNAIKINDKFDCAVTDLPYGLNSNVILQFEKGSSKERRINKKIQKKGFVRDLERFYLLFLKSLRKKLRKKAVIVFPSYADYRRLLRISKFRIEKEFSIYVHRSLTRKIVKIR